MALGDFSCANTIGPVLMELSQLWANAKTTRNPETSMALAKCILEGQGMSFLSEQQNGHCVPTKVWWNSTCTLPPVTKTTVADTSIGCNIPDGPEDEAFCETFEPNCFMHTSAKFRDQECSSELYMVNRSAEKIRDIVTALEEAILADLTTFLTANAQVNQAQPNETYGTIVGSMTQFTSAEFTTDLIGHLVKTARLNHIMDYKIVNGWNFWEQHFNARLGSCCSDAGDFRKANVHGLVWDDWQDRNLGRNSTFLFDPSRIGFANLPRFMSSTPTKMHIGVNGEEYWGWSIQSPNLSYRQVSPNGSSRLVPLRFDIEYKKVCSGRGKRNELLYDHTFAAFFNGGKYLSPVSCNNDTGILEFVNIG